MINLRLIMSMRSVKHILYVKVALKRIELAKICFEQEIQLGKVTYVPQELQIGQLPIGF